MFDIIFLNKSQDKRKKEKEKMDWGAILDRSGSVTTLTPTSEQPLQCN